VSLFSILGPAGRGARRRLCILFALAVFHADAWAEDLVGDTILLQGLNKVTARISAIRVPLGGTVRFGTLEITAHRCLKRPPEEAPESSALVEIREVRAGEGPRMLFRGWMFASSPALSALEHPVYDVWVKDCLNAKSASSKGPR
jgi:hypothetical protein